MPILKNVKFPEPQVWHNSRLKNGEEKQEENCIKFYSRFWGTNYSIKLTRRRLKFPGKKLQIKTYKLLFRFISIKWKLLNSFSICKIKKKIFNLEIFRIYNGDWFNKSKHKLYLIAYFAWELANEEIVQLSSQLSHFLVANSNFASPAVYE